MYPKKLILFNGFLEKLGGGLTSVVRIILTKGCRLELGQAEMLILLQ